MHYDKVLEATFLSRPDRFTARVLYQGDVVTVHVKNTGRCRELLVEGATVLLSEAASEQRKTRFDLIAVYKELFDGERLLINMDSMAPNAAAAEWILKSGLFSSDANLRREVKIGSSRLDLLVEQGQKRTWIEVKGVTLEEDGVARFPDAPTERGIRHLKKLMQLVEEGDEAILLFLIQMGSVRHFSPNDATHPAFGEALREAEKKGVRILAYSCHVTPSDMTVARPVPVIL